MSVGHLFRQQQQLVVALAPLIPIPYTLYPYTLYPYPYTPAPHR